MPGIPKYVSPEQYSEMTSTGEKSKLGPARIKELCEDGILPHVKTRGGQYRIKIYEDAVPIEEHEKLKKRCYELETALKTINVASKIWEGDEN